MVFYVFCFYLVFLHQFLSRRKHLFQVNSIFFFFYWTSDVLCVRWYICFPFIWRNVLQIMLGIKTNVSLLMLARKKKKSDLMWWLWMVSFYYKWTMSCSQFVNKRYVKRMSCLCPFWTVHYVKGQDSQANTTTCLYSKHFGNTLLYATPLNHELIAF